MRKNSYAIEDMRIKTQMITLLKSAIHESEKLNRQLDDMHNILASKADSREAA